MIDLHTEAKARFSLPTPPFFKKVQARAAKTAGVFVGLTTTLAALSNQLPSKLGVLATASAVAAAFFGGVAGLCSLAVDDPAAIPAAAAGVATLAEPQAGLAPDTE